MSQISKLKYVNAELGAPTSGQQTTRILFNAIPQGNSTTLSFFKSFQNLTLGQSNLTQGKLDSSESMVIKTITFLSLNGTYGPGAIPQPFGGGFPFVVSVIVGNQKVVKNFPVNQNGSQTGQYFDRLHAGATQAGEGVCEVRLLTDIVIPPQTEFSVVVESPAGFPIENGLCILSGYGKIFSAGASF